MSKDLCPHFLPETRSQLHCNRPDRMADFVLAGSSCGAEQETEPISTPHRAGGECPVQNDSVVVDIG